MQHKLVDQLSYVGGSVFLPIFDTVAIMSFVMSKGTLERIDFYLSRFKLMR